ncbi:hypothetical protein, partial [Salmonella enterica]
GLLPDNERVEFTAASRQDETHQA